MILVIQIRMPLNLRHDWLSIYQPLYDSSGFIPDVILQRLSQFMNKSKGKSENLKVKT